LPRPRASFLLLVALAAAALVPSAAGLANTEPGACLVVDPSSLGAAIVASRVIVIATVAESEPSSQVVLRPEAYLKGAARTGDLRLRYPDPLPRCPLAQFDRGVRLFIFLEEEAGTLAWPSVTEVYVLRDGLATVAGPVPDQRSEAELVAAVRAVTNQFAVPAAADAGGASIDWKGTILPIGGALAVVFVIALFLMRIWHRIDPS
jgi:hypothetical protein